MPNWMHDLSDFRLLTVCADSKVEFLVSPKFRDRSTKTYVSNSLGVCWQPPLYLWELFVQVALSWIFFILLSIRAILTKPWNASKLHLTNFMRTRKFFSTSMPVLVHNSLAHMYVKLYSDATSILLQVAILISRNFTHYSTILRVSDFLERQITATRRRLNVATSISLRMPTVPLTRRTPTSRCCYGWNVARRSGHLKLCFSGVKGSCLSHIPATYDVIPLGLTWQ